MPLEKTLLYSLAAVLFAAPLPFGSVQPLASSLLASSCLALGALWALDRSRRGLPALPWRDPLLLAGALLASLGVLQSVPLPRAVLERVSPMAAEMRSRYEPPEPSTPGSALAGEWRDWRPISLHPWATRRSTLRLLAFLIVALITVDLASSGSGRRVLVTALVASGTFQAIYGLVEMLSGHQHIFGHAKRYYTEVATGTFINRNHFAGYLEMTIPLAVALAASILSGRSADRLPSRPGREAPPGRVAFGASVLLLAALAMATALVCSRSRMGIASAFLALLTVGAFLAVRRRSRSFAAAAVILTGVTLMVFSQSDSGPLIERFAGAARELRGDIGRASIWSQAAAMVSFFPIAGVGLGAFRDVFPAFRSAGEGIAITHAHNDFMEIAAETGLAGCLLVLAGAVLVLRPLLGRPAGRPDFGHLGHAGVAGLLAIGFHSLTDFNLAIPSNALTLSVLLGLVIGWARIPAPSLATGAAPARFRLGAAVVTAGFAGVAVIAAAPALSFLDADNPQRIFAGAREEGNAAVRDLRILLRAQQTGVLPSAEAAEYVGRRLDSAIGLQSEALRRLPTSSKGHLGLGRLRVARCAATEFAGEASGGCVAVGMTDFRAALQLNPMSASTHAQVVRLLIANWPLLDGDLRNEASALAERAVALNPNDRALGADAALVLEARREVAP